MRPFRVMGAVGAVLVGVFLSACAPPPSPASSQELVVALATDMCGQGNYRIAAPLLYKPSGADWWYSTRAECIENPMRTPQEYDRIVKKILGSEIGSVDEPERADGYWRYIAKQPPSPNSGWDDMQVFPDTASLSLRLFV